MSKQLARSERSYRNEELVSAMAPELLRAKGFAAARIEKRGGMKFLEAENHQGEKVVFWLKQGWTDTPNFSAIQFGMFSEVSDPHSLSASVFVDYVAARVEGAKGRGATHALLVHMIDESIRNYVAMEIDSVTRAYATQIDRWPSRARNTKTPTLWFEDSRSMPDAQCATAVLELEVPLEQVAGVVDTTVDQPDRPAHQKVTAEVERRLLQQRFRILVGERFGWRCALSGTAIREVLDAAHLPDRDWRLNNEAADGILVRADLHRLLDAGLANISDGKFLLDRALRNGEYGQFHEMSVNQSPTQRDDHVQGQSPDTNGNAEADGG